VTKRPSRRAATWRTSGDPRLCGARAEQEGSRGALPRNLRSYLALLIQSGASGVPRETEKLDLEVHDCAGPMFQTDYNPLMPNEAEQLAQWLDVSRDELLEAISKLPEDALDYKPNPTVWSIRETLQHIANADWWYAQRLHHWPTDLFERLMATRELVKGSLRCLTDRERGQVNVHHGEEWTAASGAPRPGARARAPGADSRVGGAVWAGRGVRKTRNVRRENAEARGPVLLGAHGPFTFHASRSRLLRE